MSSISEGNCRCANQTPSPSQVVHTLRLPKPGSVEPVGPTFFPRPSPAGGPKTRAAGACGARGLDAPPRALGRCPRPAPAHCWLPLCPLGSSPAAPPPGPRLPPSPRPAWYLRSLFPEAAPFQAVRKAIDAGRTRTGARAAPRGGGGGSGGSGGGRDPRLLPGAASARQGRRRPEQNWGPTASRLPSRAVENHYYSRGET